MKPENNRRENSAFDLKSSLYTLFLFLSVITFAFFSWSVFDSVEANYVGVGTRTLIFVLCLVPYAAMLGGLIARRVRWTKHRRLPLGASFPATVLLFGVVVFLVESAFVGGIPVF